ncbi:diguanylate cyclase domain-containing protein [Ureibacillus acetophenoni]
MYRFRYTLQNINDQWGHDTGDLVLQETAKLHVKSTIHNQKNVQLD